MFSRPGTLLHWRRAGDHRTRYAAQLYSTVPGKHLEVVTGADSKCHRICLVAGAPVIDNKSGLSQFNKGIFPQGTQHSPNEAINARQHEVGGKTFLAPDIQQNEGGGGWTYAGDVDDMLRHQDFSCSRDSRNTLRCSAVQYCTAVRALHCQ